MKLRGPAAAIAVITVVILAAAVTVLHMGGAVILNPKGMVADQERTLLIVATGLSLLVIIPVFIMTLVITWRYRETNTKATYQPNWDRSRTAETIWWLIPTALILALSIITWQSSHSLDPAKALASSTPPITVQVIALDWKWLFIYPDQHVASVNMVQFPEGTPVHFVITSDAPMNSFWIPALGGQIYAMPGMSTQLNLMANTTGDFKGSSANISGVGFASMRFVARSSSQLAFEQWVAAAKASGNALTQASYDQLAKPSSNNAVKVYTLTDRSLYDRTVMKYMMPLPQSSELGSYGSTQ
ncbi:ubiquinol oxidase subunit II [Candidatus Saccharibacteria bacterium]|nr:ubiquinol oxidase subunit II [Candidatus Saccharibacteria bacterium]